MTTTHKDPAGRTEIPSVGTVYKSEYQATTYYFCSSGCKESFEKAPEKYIGRTAAAHAHRVLLKRFSFPRWPARSARAGHFAHEGIRRFILE